MDLEVRYAPAESLTSESTRFCFGPVFEYGAPEFSGYGTVTAGVPRSFQAIKVAGAGIGGGRRASGFRRGGALIFWCLFSTCCLLLAPMPAPMPAPATYAGTGTCHLNFPGKLFL